MSKGCESVAAPDAGVKLCKVCGAVKEPRSDQRGWRCMPCRRSRELARYYENRPKRLEQMRANAKTPKARDRRNAYYRENQPEIRAYRKQRHDPVKNREKCREYRTKNASALNQRRRQGKRAQVAKDPAKFLLIHAEWRKTPSGKAHISANYYKRKAAKKSATAIRCASPAELKALMAAIDDCQYCGKSAPLTWDHIIPITRGGDHGISNLARVCKSCNCSKQNREPREWFISRGIDPARFLKDSTSISSANQHS